MTQLNNTRFSQDANSVPIPVVAPGASARIAAVGATSSRVSLPGAAAAGSIVRVAVTQDCYVAFGTNTVVATTSDVLMTSGAIEYLKVPAGATDIAAIQASTAGTLTITEML